MCHVKYGSIFYDILVKERPKVFSVIPADAGIQSIPAVTRPLDTGFHRCDNFFEVGNLYSSFSVR